MTYLRMICLIAALMVVGAGVQAEDVRGATAAPAAAPVADQTVRAGTLSDTALSGLMFGVMARAFELQRADKITGLEDPQVVQEPASEDDEPLIGHYREFPEPDDGSPFGDS